MNKTVLVIALIVILLGGFALVQSQKKSQTTTNTTPSTSQPTVAESKPTTASAPADSSVMKKETVKEFTVSGKNFSFSPSTLTVNQGDSVKITFKNEGGFHDFQIEDLNVGTKQLQTGQEETIEFVAEKPGTFEYFCSVGNHRAMGMKGTLTVK